MSKDNRLLALLVVVASAPELKDGGRIDKIGPRSNGAASELSHLDRSD